MAETIHATYLSKMSPDAAVHVAGGVIYAKDGILLVHKPEHTEEIDDLIATRPDWRQMFQKVDIEAADRLARAHLDATRPHASKGASSSVDPAKQRHEASGDMLRAAQLVPTAKAEPLQVMESVALSTTELGADGIDPNAGKPDFAAAQSLAALQAKLHGGGK